MESNGADTHTACTAVTGLTASPASDSYVETRTPNITMFRDRTFKEVIKVKRGPKPGALTDRPGVIRGREPGVHVHRGQAQGGHKMAALSTLRRPHQKPALLTP